MRLRLALALAFAPATLCGQAADTPLAARVDSLAAQILRSTGVPSASVAVVQHGRLAYAQAYGDARLEPEVRATPDMRYSIGSISKQFCAAAILLLQQQGKLSLNDRVARFLPKLAHGNEVTIRQLLSHTSGYQDYWPQDYLPPDMLQPVTAGDIMNRWATKPLDFTPGSRWQYSNTNYVIAGAIVERASGLPFMSFIRQRILAPLGMTSVLDIDTGRLTESDPTGYLRYALGPLHPAPKEGSGWLFAAGELAMTPRDLASWDIAMLDQRLLAPPSWQAMETEVQLTSGVGTRYGLGVQVGMDAGHRLISHTGEVSGFTAANLVYPDDSAAVIVLTNQDAAPAASAIAAAVGRLLFQTQDAETTARTVEARGIFEGLQHGRIDRTLFTPDANAYFGQQALDDFASSLGPLGTPEAFVQVSEGLRGGMVLRVFRITFAGGKVLRAWTFQTPDGKLEQYQVAPVG